MARAGRPSPPLLVVSLGALIVSSALITAAPSYASCPEGQFEDPNTRMCWTQIAPDLVAGMSGEGPCLPGRLGNCVASIYSSGAGGLQDTYMDGKNK